MHLLKLVFLQLINTKDLKSLSNFSCIHLLLTQHLCLKNRRTYHVHVNAIGVCPCMLEVFLQSLPQRVWDLMKADELLHSQHLHVVPCGSRVESLDYCGYISKNASVH